MNVYGGNDTVSAIKEVELENLILELNDIVDKVEFALRNIEMLVYDSKDFFKGKVAESMRTKFSTYTNQIDLLKTNLISYPNDLIKVKNGQLDTDKQSADTFYGFRTEVNKEQNDKIMEK